MSRVRIPDIPFSDIVMSFFGIADQILGVIRPTARELAQIYRFEEIYQTECKISPEYPD